MKRNVAIEIRRETSEESQRFCRMHEEGAKQWGANWYTVNRYVKYGAAGSGLVNDNDADRMRLIYTAIAYRMCVQLFGIPGKFAGVLTKGTVLSPATHEVPNE